jgi:hypothetical protein
MKNTSGHERVLLTFMAAVGSDHPEKQELEPRILGQKKVVADVLEQSATIGELHHALDAELMIKRRCTCGAGRSNRRCEEWPHLLRRHHSF